MVRMRHRLIVVCRESTRIQRAGAQRDRLVTLAGVRARFHHGGTGERVVKNTASALLHRQVRYHFASRATPLKRRSVSRHEPRAIAALSSRASREGSGGAAGARM